MLLLLVPPFGWPHILPPNFFMDFFVRVLVVVSSSASRWTEVLQKLDETMSRRSLVGQVTKRSN